MSARRISLISSIPLLVGFVLLFIAAVSAVFLARQQQEIDAQLRHTLEVDDDLLRIQTLIVDAESGQRGYLLTGRLSYLDPYNIAKRTLPGELRGLRSALGSAVSEFDELSTTAAKKLAELQNTIDLRAANKPESALAIVNNDSGKRFIDRIRVILADMRGTQETFLEARSVEAARLNESRRTILLTSVLLVIVLGLITLFSNLQRLRELQLVNDKLRQEAVERRAAETQVQQLQKM
ncbi:MAG TPA: CHASE3 domain-containing protein, partial [Methylovirgula sp.]